MRVYLALSAVVITFCSMGRGEDDELNNNRHAAKIRPEWQEWLISGTIWGIALIGLALLGAWLSPPS